MPEHQQTQQSTESKTTSQKQATPRIQTPVSHPMAIIQRARVNPKSLTHADVMQLQRTIGNRAVGRLLSEIGLIPSKAKQVPPVQRQELIQRQEIPEEEETCPSCVQRQEKPEEKEPLQGKFETIQRLEPEEEEKLQMKSVMQRQEISEEEDEPVQGKMIGTVQRQEIPEEEPLQPKRENNTGMPDNLKAGVESLSGIDMSDVRVHYNSSKPAEVGALACTQGTNIHVAPGQERHLSHEAWHVVQQAQGRVRPTIQLKDGLPVNDDKGLEREANVMGTRAFKTGQDTIFRQELIAHELTHVVQQNGDHLIQAKFIPAPTENEPNRHFDDFLGSYIDKISDIDGHEPWKKFYQGAEKSWWIYMPETEYRSEKYVRQDRFDLDRVALDKLKEVDENEREDHKVKRKLESGKWEDLTVTKNLSEGDGKLLKENMITGEREWKVKNQELYSRISKTFPILIQAIDEKILELTPDIIKKVNDVLTPLSKPKLVDKDIMKVSQALTELDYAALVISTEKLDTFILGAQSRVRAPGQKDLPKQEVTHGRLPPLGVLNMEVDAYYLSADRKLHADEVKDTPNALADKAKDGGQIGRQIEWLTWDVIDPKTKQYYNKEVHYFVRAEGPKFDSVLSEEVINNLSQLEIFQMGVQFIHIGSSHHYMPQELKGLYDKAIAWLGESNPKLKEMRIKPSEAATKYFGDLSTALLTIKNGPLV